MKKTTFVLISVLVVLFAGQVKAQEVYAGAGSELASDPMNMQEVAAIVNFLQVTHAVPLYDSIPMRELVLTLDQVNIYTGIVTDLSKNYAGKGWFLPFGAGIGLLPKLEVGFDSMFLAHPWGSSAIITKFSFYGRYLIIPRALAAQLTIWVPTAVYNQFGLELLLPGRMRFGPLELFGQFKFNYFNGYASDALTIGLMVSALFTVVDDFFIAFNTGFSYSRWGMDTGAATNNMIVPIEVGVGYRISSNSFLKALFSFPDFASEDGAGDFNGYDSRRFIVSFVQTFDLSPYCASPEEDCPACPEVPTAPVTPSPTPTEKTPPADTTTDSATPTDSASDTDKPEGTEKKTEEEAKSFEGWDQE
ncbi:MAG: hypothetical protein JRJ19_16810 [Deltaproteobacteria bacterium]|nr:hypothetical protein [Deltaproteobacteria bacterium]MBW1873725.1 hypothetical protein [Deltaproteobacteria bacterium]